MKTSDELSKSLTAIDGKGYGAYKSVKGSYDLDDFVLHIDHVQGDPFAAPSRLRAVFAADVAGIPSDLLGPPVRKRAAADFLNRRLAGELAAASRNRGSGKSGVVRILRPRQCVLERTSLAIGHDGTVTARFVAGLPARGRRVLGRQADEMLTSAIPQALRRVLAPATGELDAMRRHADLVQDSAALRDALGERGLVAFVPDGAILPRRSGVDDRPLAADRAVVFEAPERLRVSLEAPNRGTVTGLGIPEGITLIVGGGYHGKSTLLRAIETGIYDHIEGDGRELAVTVPDAVKIRAEDGRSVAGVDISNFITGLPLGEDTAHFSTANASGSTSQAAAIAEALEVGATCLLIDEDTSATNFMIRDARMQALIHDDDEPITPFIDRARQMHRELGVSTVLVVGGAGDYFDVADTVIGMRRYLPADLTEQATDIGRRIETERVHEGGDWSPLRRRAPDPASVDARKGKKPVSIKIQTPTRVLFGTQELDLSALEQLVEEAQVRAIARALVHAAERHLDGDRTVRGALERLMGEIRERGLGVIDRRESGDYAAFRIHELAAALSRLRSLQVRSIPE
ncbi:MAG: ABC-ATPase domain-containing protein [Gemmatimonadetes bacterium]|uniref:ABC-ATPase domain-containing protein n=1 Tax=Candidatus Kutchimonas denitrificans TaxID=3056748 RepID=A0AAE5CBS3_9BACT|nr:ABC-ATPase domain-containing protein [Gemmatimonadota bacterium]NIR74775.1 ABC-ATPase domain-containing protein [Candidatus Kutchimonas denitrificans]NIS01525.1 ABC-ATPase domain-containing protein [Gemmatimonadota bacterium]NIT67266.1 ABC-ATPase domain-containing protein [Gemmatimonadota bacterium]NIU52440.1 ATPase [Gemmatimonadota bacterium]